MAGQAELQRRIENQREVIGRLTAEVASLTWQLAESETRLAIAKFELMDRNQ